MKTNMKAVTPRPRDSVGINLEMRGFHKERWDAKYAKPCERLLTLIRRSVVSVGEGH